MTNYLLSSASIDVLRSQLEGNSLNNIIEILKSQDKENVIVKSFEKRNDYIQYESTIKKKGETITDEQKYLQQSVKYIGSNSKLKAEVAKYIADYEKVSLYNKLESSKPVTKIFIERSENNSNISLFVVETQVEIVNSWFFWMDRKLTISTYSCLLQFL